MEGKRPGQRRFYCDPFGNEMHRDEWLFYYGGASRMADSVYLCPHPFGGNTGCRCAGMFKKEITSLE